MVVFAVPGTVLQLWAELDLREMRRSFAKLHSFDLREHTACYSDSDRTMLIDLIAQWFSDANSGETDPVRLRQLGIHRFEKFVRFEIAPQLTQDTRVLVCGRSRPRFKTHLLADPGTLGTLRVRWRLLVSAE